MWGDSEGTGVCVSVLCVCPRARLIKIRPGYVTGGRAGSEGTEGGECDRGEWVTKSEWEGKHVAESKVIKNHQYR